MREGKIKGRAFVHFAFGPRTSAMARNDASDDREADARAVEFLRGMQALEHAK
jgi:hypothetical protein